MLNRTCYARPTKGHKFFEQLKAGQADPVIGIRIIMVTRHDSTGFYVVDLAPRHSITPHYRWEGCVICQIVQGD